VHVAELKREKLSIDDTGFASGLVSESCPRIPRTCSPKPATDNSSVPPYYAVAIPKSPGPETEHREIKNTSARSSGSAGVGGGMNRSFAGFTCSISKFP
jgi:hypothetical protein